MTLDNTFERVPTGIRGFDNLTGGGLPKWRTTLVSGTPGSGKTVFSSQFLCEGAYLYKENGILITFDESPDDIIRNMIGFGYDVKWLVDEGRIAFIDCSPHAVEGPEAILSKVYDLSALLGSIENAQDRTGAVRVVIDSVNAMFHIMDENQNHRHEMARLSSALRNMNVTTVMTAERKVEPGSNPVFQDEDFVADNIILLRNLLEEEKRRRTLEVLKFRGAFHREGMFPFTIVAGKGLVIIPLTREDVRKRPSDFRVTSGNKGLDGMLRGGFHGDSINLITGSTGTGKTLLATQFITGGAEDGEKGLLFSFEEDREQLLRDARGWGVDMDEMESRGLVKVVCGVPEEMGIDHHLVMMRDEIDDFVPDRVAVDSLFALNRISSKKGYMEFIFSLSSYIRDGAMVGLYTTTGPSSDGRSTVVEDHQATLADSIIHLRHFEVGGSLRRGLSVLKLRGSDHEKGIKEFTIDGNGLHIGDKIAKMN